MKPNEPTDPHATDNDLTRRQALAALAGLSVTALLATCGDPESANVRNRDRGKAGGVLKTENRDTLGAAADRVFPGATAAGVLDFFANTLTHRVYAGVRRQFDQAAVLLNRAARAQHQRAFAACSGLQQDALLVAFRHGKASGGGFDSNLFYKRFVVLVMEGLLADPRYGGNRDQAGWKLVGHHSCYFAPRRLQLLTNPKYGMPY